MNFDELAQRTAVFTKYKSLLDQQKKALSDYMYIIDARDLALHDGNIDKLDEYTGFEQTVIKSISQIQDCLIPLKPVYENLYPQGHDDIYHLETKLEKLRAEILKKNDESRLVLKTELDRLRKEISRVRVTHGSGNQVYSSSVPNMVNLST